ncbi:MAG TPA: alpha/beta hydrolase [Anaerolineae bacterium]
MSTKPIYKSPAGEKAVMALYDAVLAKWPVPFETLDISTQHGNTFVISCGNSTAPPLVLLHGAGTNSAIWAGDVVEYGRHYHVYAVDLLGEPGKSAPNRLSWEGPAYVEWLEELLDALKIGKATFIGISQGAWTALKFAVSQPARVDKLVLLSPGGVVPDRISFAIQALLFASLGRWGARRLTQLIYGNQPIPEGVEEITLLIMSHFKARVGILPLFSDEELQRLTMPTFLLGGEQDALRDLEKIAARLRLFVPHLTVTIIPEAGHALLNTTEYVMSFLASAETA